MIENLLAFNALELVIKGLAVWRISHALMYEMGPFALLLRVRRLTGIRHDIDGTPVGYPDGNVFGCLWCLSFWVALVAMFLPVLFFVPFALSAIAILIELLTDYLAYRRL